MISIGRLFFKALILISSSAFANNEKMKRVMDAQMKNHQQGIESQKRVSQMADQTRDFVYEYSQTLRQIDNLRTYNKQLRQLIEDQKQEVVSIREQTKDVKQTRQEIVPFMLEMYSVLENFVQMDIPFLKQERQNRLNEIKQIMNRADVSVSEKYRRLMEAYQIENTYGNTLEAYQGVETINGKELSVDYLRIGRLALIYQTLDRNTQAYWNPRKKEWERLSSRYRRNIENGLKIARKQLAPNLLTIPIPAPLKTEKKL